MVIQRAKVVTWLSSCTDELFPLGCVVVHRSACIDLEFLCNNTNARDNLFEDNSQCTSCFGNRRIHAVVLDRRVCVEEYQQCSCYCSWQARVVVLWSVLDSYDILAGDNDWTYVLRQNTTPRQQWHQSRHRLSSTVQCESIRSDPPWECHCQWSETYGEGIIESMRWKSERGSMLLTGNPVRFPNPNGTCNEIDWRWHFSIDRYWPTLVSSLLAFHYVEWRYQSVRMVADR